MGVFKEEVSALENLQRQQRQIWSDAADMGVIATDEVKDTMRWVIKSLLALDESKIVWRMDGEVTQRQYELTVYFSMEDGVTFDVLYYKGHLYGHKGVQEFFSITSRRAPSLVPDALHKEFDNVSDEERRVG